ncbi:MAG TPA: ATP-binding protein [Xanthomonadales bacterium]|nr:ATP-binding protein [Xanthomonadales bacterium]
MTTAEWNDANTGYVSAAVAWVRALLRERAKPSTVAAAPQRGSAAQPRSFWRSVGRRRILVSEQAVLPETRLIAIESGERASAAAAEMRDRAAAMTPPPALLTLAQKLELSEFERNVLLLCAAADLDTSVAALCAQAQGEASRPYPTFALASALFDDPAWDAISPERPLRYWRLIEIGQSGAVPLIVSPLSADERIVNVLKGVTYLDDRLMPMLTAVPDPGDDVPPSQQIAAQRIVDELRVVSQQLTPIQLLGTDGASKLVVAGLVCRACGLRAYRLDWRLLPTAPADLESLARLWQRESLLLPVALYLETDGGEIPPSGPVDMVIARLPGALVFLATRHLRAVSARAPIAADVDKPTEEEQRACWAAALGGAADGIPQALAAQFDLNAETIRDLVRRAVTGAETDRETLRDRLWDGCRGLTRPRLDTLAHRVVPRATWDDIVLPDAETAMLRQIADQVGHRSTVYGTWGFAQRMSRGLGIIVLFAGASGSGKTMAAEVIANELRLDLFRIDLSAVMSKYIGETEANLRRLFDAAEDGGAILLFDEADALFGKRTEVKDSHDRYANIEINYLLQRMESYRGLAILATNMKSALDQAFMRRLRFVVDFPFPGVPERKLMWQKAFPPGTPTEALDMDRLARLNVTGGHIAVIALNAAFAAAHARTPVTTPLVLDAARIEFRKLGRPISENDFRWQPAAGAVPA